MVEAQKTNILTNESLSVLHNAIQNKNVKMPEQSPASQIFWQKVTEKLSKDKKGLQTNLDTFMFKFGMPILLD